MTTVTVRGLGVELAGARIVSDVGFSVRPGRVTAFVGVNGSGKTTTLRAMTDLLDHAGEALYDGVRYRDLPSPMTTVGVLFDGLEGHPHATARRHLAMLARAAGVNQRRVNEMLEEVDLTRAADRRIGQFSMGMRQRLGLAAALLADPAVLLLDEPANGLDPLGLHWLHLLLRRQADAGRAVLLSSHLLAQAEACADDVVLLHGGTVRRVGELRDVVGGSRARLLTDHPDELALRLAEAGYDVRREGRETVLVSTRADAAQETRALARIARDAGILVHGLTVEATSLDETFRAETAAPLEPVGVA